MDLRSVQDCSFYIQGKCLKGATCPFKHDSEKASAFLLAHREAQARQDCYFFVHGRCSKGSLCPYKHDEVGVRWLGSCFCYLFSRRGKYFIWGRTSSPTCEAIPYYNVLYIKPLMVSSPCRANFYLKVYSQKGQLLSQIQRRTKCCKSKSLRHRNRYRHQPLIHRIEKQIKKVGIYKHQQRLRLLRRHRL